ncbi:MAG: hypothetical protein RR585_00820 [Coprobacillus sp.]
MVKEKVIIILKYVLLLWIGVWLSRYYFRFCTYMLTFISNDTMSDKLLSLGLFIVYIALVFPLILILLKKISAALSIN